MLCLFCSFLLEKGSVILNQKVTYIINGKSWIEGNAKAQLENLAELEGVHRMVGLPDLHPGKVPVGAVIEVEDGVYPHLIGNDIGCGMSFFQTGLTNKHYKQEKWTKRLEQFDLSKNQVENPYPEESPIPDLGTIGGGNHFAEFQKIHTVFDQEELERMGLSNQDIFLLIHSGSRSFGQSIFNDYADSRKKLKKGSDPFAIYMKYHNLAVLWAERNRKMAAEVLLSRLGFQRELNCIVDCIHNYIEERNGFYLHRKGAVSTENGAVVIPGSRGSLTYLVRPTPDTEISLFSLSHGAGRKYQRSLCKERIRGKHTKNDLKHTALKSRVICRDFSLYYEEAPEVYKNIDQIIECLKEFHLIHVIAAFQPLITYKG